MRSPQAPARPRGPSARRRYDPETLIAAGKWSPDQQAKISKVMHEYKAGTLTDGHGGRVTNKRQALAIALSEARGLTAAGKYDERKHRRKRKGERGGGRFDRKDKPDTTVDPEDVMALMDWTNPALDRMARTPAQRRAVGLMAAGWDESKHPRDPGGEGGGQWTNSLESEQSGGDGGDAARAEIKARRDRARKQIEEMSGKTPTEQEITQALKEEDQFQRGATGGEDPHEEILRLETDASDKTAQVYGDPLESDMPLVTAISETLQDGDQAQAEEMATGLEDWPAGQAINMENLLTYQRQLHSEMLAEPGIELEARAQAHVAEGFQPTDGEPGEWMQLENPATGETVDLTVGEPDRKTLPNGEVVEWDEEARAWFPTGYNANNDEDMQASAITASAAGLAPMVPPRSWFDRPKLDGPTAMTVTADGQVYGHAALWGTCHTGMPGTCRTPPRSQSDYRFFHLGEVDTDQGPVHVGRVTMDTGHAPMTASHRGTIAHYDDTGTGIAHVRAYEDDHGIVLAGALVPDAPAEKARRFKGATVSGDWRSIGGKLEMVGMLAVNVPGFPVPRAMAASLLVEDEPHTMSLVAAGMYCSPEDEKRKLKALIARALGGVDGLVSAAGVRSKSDRRMGVTAAGRPFDPSKHPRAPAGDPGGGRWVRVVNKETGETTYREGLPSQIVKELRAEGVDVGGIDSPIAVQPMAPGKTPEEDARVRGGESGSVQDKVVIQRHGLKYSGTIVKVTPGAAMVEYTTNNGKTKTIRVPHREYEVID